MKTKGFKITLFALLLLAFLIPNSQATSGQKLSGGTKLVGTTPFVFAEAKLWLIAIQLGVGPNFSSPTNPAYDDKPFYLSMTGKFYPFRIMNLSPYIGLSNRFSLRFRQSRLFSGVEFSLPSRNSPFLAFMGADYITVTEDGSGGFGWHLGVKYTFSF